MTGNLILDIVIVAAAALVLLGGLILGGVVNLEGFGVRLSARRNAARPKTDILKGGRVGGHVGAIKGQDVSGGATAIASDINIGERLVVEPGARIDEITGAKISGTGKDGAQ